MKPNITLTLAFILLFAHHALAQNCEPNNAQRKKMEIFADNAGRELMECCTELGSKDFQTEVFYGYQNGTCQSYVSGSGSHITMKVSWKGKLTGRSFWIKGILYVDDNTMERSWTKISDSKGFVPYCSRGCIQ